MTDQHINHLLAEASIVLVLLSSAPPNHIAEKLPELIEHLKAINEAIRSRQLQPGQMRIA